MDLKDLGAKLVLLLTDPHLAGGPVVATVAASLEAEKVPFEVFDRVRVEPSDQSFREAIAFARRRPYAPSWRWAGAPPWTPPRRSIST